MNTVLKTLLGLAIVAASGAASADITFFENDNFNGRHFSTREPIDDFRGAGFNDRASSVIVTGRPWEVCDDAGFHGHCVVLRPGQYPALAAMRLNDRLSSARAVVAGPDYGEDRYAPLPPPGQVTFYEGEGFRGRAFTTADDVPSLRRFGYNDRASSAVVLNDRWEVCDDEGFSGHCIVLRPGNYPDLRAFGLDDRISSARRLDPGMVPEDGRYAPPAPPPYDWRPRPQEQLFQADVIASRAVYGTPGQHCWMDRQQVRDNGNQVGGAVIGGILGGILGHQIAHGNGATIVGVVGGAAVGSAIGNNMDGTRTEEVRRCEPAQVQGPPLYWDTTYLFRGQEHHVQTTAPAGPQLTVNGNGEPRMQR